MAWTVYVADTVTGTVRRELPGVKTHPWADTLDIGRGTTLSVNCAAETDTIGYLWSLSRAPWRYTLLLAWDGTAVVACPLVTSQWNDIATEVQFGCPAPATLLAKRLVITPGQGYTPEATAANVKLGPTTLPNIARQLITQAITDSSTPGAALPLVLTTVPTVGQNTRTYDAADLDDYREVLARLADVENGPEIHLQAVLAPDRRTFWWEVRIGTPLLANPASAWTWTYGSPNCVSVGVDIDGSQMANRVYCAGRPDLTANAGTTLQITPLGFAEDLALPNAGFPLLEAVDSTPGTGADDATPTRDQLTAKAREAVRLRAVPVETWNVRVKAATTPAIGTFRLGDPARIVHHGHRLLGDGEARRRILGISGNEGDTITLETNSVPGVV